jgi:hypothetical protein
MTSQSLTFDAVAEPPRPRWYAHWHRSWSAHETWFRARVAAAAPRWVQCEVARAEHMPDSRRCTAS